MKRNVMASVLSLLMLLSLCCGCQGKNGEGGESTNAPDSSRMLYFDEIFSLCQDRPVVLWGDRIFEKCGIRRDEEGDGGKTLEIRGKRRLSARDGGANYQQS